jgi:dTDP-glucose pyrophosphorylase
MSFVKFDSNGEVIQIAEKKRISDWASVGAYGFKSSILYKELYEKYYSPKYVEAINGEHYIAPMYQMLLMENKAVHAPKLSGSSVHILGTPVEVLQFDPMAKPPFGSVIS